MKKLAVFTMCLLLIIGGGGCANNKTASNDKKAETQVDNAIAANEPENVIGGSTNSSAITEDEAKQIALNKAGLSADEVVFDRVERDYDNGVEHYEVEFRKGRIEYSADIAMDGTIIEWEVDND